MKEMTCATAGGPATCNAVLTGSTAEEMMDNGMKHVTEAHPEMAADIQKMSEEDKGEFFAEFQTKFDALSEVSA